MDFGFIVKNTLATLILPPFGPLLLALIGWFLMNGRPRLGRWLMAGGILLIWILSTPLVSRALMSTLEIPYQAISGQEADVIVILGGGINADAPEYNGDTLNGRTLERVRYGARLQRQTGKPVLVTGGAVNDSVAEAPLMQDVLEKEFGVPVQWVEARSTNTHENAKYSAEILKVAGIRRVYLVSHAWHLPRASYEFMREGLQVIPAGTGYNTSAWNFPFEYLPNIGMLGNSYYACHEWLGRVWAWFNP